jgi:hypothetical protein
MAWEKRGCSTYYYRKQRNGDRVSSVYVGRGLSAEMCAEEDMEERLGHAAFVAARREMVEAEAATDRQMNEIRASILRITNTALQAAGFHKHKGQWRKKRYV